MFVDLPPAGEELVKGVRADGAHRGEADRRPDRETAAHPVPHRQHFRGAELLRELRIGADGIEMSSAPALGGFGVRHRFLGGEGLRGDDEERLLGLGAVEGALQIVRVDVGGEAHVERLVGERVGEQTRAEIGAARAQIHDALDAFFTSEFFCKGTHARQCFGDFLSRSRRAQRRMPRRALLGGVDDLA